MAHISKRVYKNNWRYYLVEGVKMVIKNEDRPILYSREDLSNPRVGIYLQCGQPIFKLETEFDGLGERSWWHELDVLDKKHAAEPKGECNHG